MLLLNKKSTVKGISLIEILVSILVVSFGLLALASFEAKLMSQSGENKTKSEAQVLAEDKIEQLNNNIIKTGFDAALVDGTESITGTNASFTRTWTVTDGALTNHKLLSVVVSWGNAADEQVTIENELVWSDASLGLVAAAAAAGAGTGALAPSPNNNSSTEGGESRSSTTDGTQLGDPMDASDPLTNFWVARDSNDQLTVHFDGETGALLTCHGDTAIAFTGTVFSVNVLNTIDVDISQLGQCFFDAATVQSVSGYNYVKYACIACGNCDEGGAGCPATPSINNDIGPGGWRGKIGLRGVDDVGGGAEQVCFNEQILDPDAGASTGREYTTIRTNGAVISSEGINTPYECHDFLVVNRSGPDSSCSTAANDLTASTNIAPKKFTRNLAGTDPNTVLAADDTYCTLAPSSVTLTGDITLVQTGGPSVNLNKLTLAMDASGTCDTLISNTPGTYSISCNATTVATDVTITLTTTQSGAVITPVSSYTVSNADNASAFNFTVTK